MSGGRLILPATDPVFTSGALLNVGATMTVYLTGTNTLADIFAEPALMNALMNPQVSNSAGRFYTQATQICADVASAYDVVLALTDGEQFTYDQLYVVGPPIDTSGFLENPDVVLTGVPTAPTPAANDVSSKIATTQFVQSALAALVVFPSGMVVPFAMSTAPTGWLICNGSAVSRTTYAALFAAIGTTWGIGDGTTTFNLPNMGGQFLRGWVSGQMVDSGRSFGSSQLDEFQGHYHNPLAGTGFYGFPSGPGVIQEGSGNATVLNPTTGAPLTDGANGTPRTGTETRPVNLAMIYAIKT